MVKWSDLLLGVRAIARVVGSIPRPSCENSSDQELCSLGCNLVSSQCKCSTNTGYFQSQFDVELSILKSYIEEFSILKTGDFYIEDLYW